MGGPHPAVQRIAGKLAPPAVPPGVVDRSRLTQLLDPVRRVALVVAPPGYGKTVLAAQWSATRAPPTAWLSLDLLDDDPVTFWSHFIGAVRVVVPGVDDEPALSLLENPAGHRFLAVLIGQIERSPGHAVLVLDDLARLTDRSILDGLALIVERVGDRLRLVITARADPGLPIARWRAAGWVVDVREDVLRLDDAEALAAAATFDDLDLTAETLVAVNGRVDGWPIAFHLALVSITRAGDQELDALALRESDRHVADFLVGEILDQLPARHRDVALALSVVDWFDTEIAHQLAGPDVGPIVTELQRRRLLPGSSGAPPGTLRFHPLVRELLEGELKWRDPERHVRLHRVAAEIWQRRGDLNAAYYHLTAIGDVDAANGLVLEPALGMLDRGDLAGLTRVVNSLPSTLQVDDPALAMDIASLCFIAGNRSQAERWCDRAEALITPDHATLQLRLHFGRATIALYDGDVDAAAAYVTAFEELEPHAEVGPGEHRIPTVATRVALERGNVGDARRWLDRLRTTFDQTEIVARLFAPAFEAWLDIISGRLQRAIALIEPVCDWAEREAPAHFGRLEANLTAAWCRLSVGDFARADEYAGAAQLDAQLIGFEWNYGRAGVVAAEVRMLMDGPSAALAVVRGVRPMLQHRNTALEAKLDLVEAKALHRMGRAADANKLLAALGPRPGVSLLRAEMALSGGRPADVAALLADADSWLMPERLEADVLTAAADTTTSANARLAAVLDEAAAEGWVQPFLAHGVRVDQLLLQQPLERVHPDLARHLRAPPTSGSARTSRPVEELTPREHTILELLPSHLSYAEIGTRLYLSVNTVKSNLKSVYRKLTVTTRAEAVDAARAAGLL